MSVILLCLDIIGCVNSWWRLYQVNGALMFFTGTF